MLRTLFIRTFHRNFDNAMANDGRMATLRVLIEKAMFFFHSIWEQNLPNRIFLLQIRFLEWAFQEVVGWANGSSVKLQSILYFQFMRLQTWDKLLIQKLNRIFYIKKYSVISAFRMKTFAIFYHSLNVTSSLLFSC